MKSTRSVSLYRVCQLTGWSIAALYWSYTAFTQSQFDIAQGAADFVLDVAIGIVVTHIYRLLVLRWGWHRLDLTALLPRILPAVVVLAAVYSGLIACKLYGVRLFFAPTWLPGFDVYFRNNVFTLFITGIRLLSIWVLAYHLYQYAQREIAIARENARLSVVAKEAQLSRLSAQLNPHFFFNSLNTIKFLTATNPGSARRSIDLLSGLLRHTLYTQQDTLMRLDEELALVKDYLELEQLRFEERLHYTITLEDGCDGHMIPPFSVQTLVENALKHGIDKRKAGGHIDVMVTLPPGGLLVKVRNTGTLLPTENHTGLGIQNLKARLHLQFGAQAHFNITETESDCVEATLLIPRL